VATEIIICDSDVMIDYWNVNNQRHSITKNVLENSVGLNNIMLSAITQMELIVGAINKNELNSINKNIHQFEIALVDNRITNVAVQLVQDYTLSHGLAIADSLIAATALILELQLFTYNIKHYRFINGLSLYNA